MGLQTDVDTSKSSNSSSSSGSSSGGHDFPKYQKKCPRFLITEDDGDYEFLVYPDTPEVTLKQEWYGQPWEIDDPVPTWSKCWFDSSGFDNIKYNVEKQLGLELLPVLRDNPEKGVELINRAARLKAPGETFKPERNCAVCETTLNLNKDEYEQIDHRVVCTNHTVEDLKHADLI